MSKNRHPALQELTRDHQRILDQARSIHQLLEGDAGTGSTSEFVEQLLAFWDEYCVPHLREEEEVTYPFFLKHAPDAEEDVNKLYTDHDWLREKFEELAHLPRHENCTPLLKSIAQYMTSHVRHEELVIYDHIQGRLDKTALDELVEQSADFRDQHRA